MSRESIVGVWMVVSAILIQFTFGSWRFSFSPQYSVQLAMLAGGWVGWMVLTVYVKRAFYAEREGEGEPENADAEARGHEAFQADVAGEDPARARVVWPLMSFYLPMTQLHAARLREEFPACATIEQELIKLGFAALDRGMCTPALLCGQLHVADFLYGCGDRRVLAVVAVRQGAGPALSLCRDYEDGVETAVMGLEMPLRGLAMPSERRVSMPGATVTQMLERLDAMATGAPARALPADLCISLEREQYQRLVRRKAMNWCTREEVRLLEQDENPGELVLDAHVTRRCFEIRKELRDRWMMTLEWLLRRELALAMPEASEVAASRACAGRLIAAQGQTGDELAQMIESRLGSDHSWMSDMAREYEWGLEAGAQLAQSFDDRLIVWKKGEVPVPFVVYELKARPS